MTSVNELNSSAHHIKGCWQVVLCGCLCSVWLPPVYGEFVVTCRHADEGEISEGCITIIFGVLRDIA